MSTNIRGVPGCEADTDTSGFSMWREHFLATGMETSTLCSQGLCFERVSNLFLFFHLSGSTQLCRACSVSQCPMECAGWRFPVRVSHPRVPAQPFPVPPQPPCGVCTAGTVFVSEVAEHGAGTVGCMCHPLWSLVCGQSVSEITTEHAAQLAVVSRGFFL